MGCYPADVTRNPCYKPDRLPARSAGGGMLSMDSLTLVYIESATFDVELLETFGGQGPLKMSWLRVLDIPFHILASLLYRSTRHSRPGCTNMAPRAPRVRQGPETHATTTRLTTRSTGFASQVAGPSGPYGRPGSLGPAAATLGSSGSAAQELLGHAAEQRVQRQCCLDL